MSAKVSLNTSKLQRTLDDLIGLCVTEVGRALVDIADDAEEHAEGKWYSQVRERTGQSGKLQTTLRVSSSLNLEAIVSAENKVGYLVHRPGPLSMLSERIGKRDYAAMMSYYRKNGTLPPNVTSDKTSEDGRPEYLKRFKRNPLASDGKNLFAALVRGEGKKIVELRVDDIDTAMQRAADRLRQR